MAPHPLPCPDPQTRPFWDACLAGKLLYQRCTSCGTTQFTPRVYCERCHSAALKWHESARLGKVLSLTRVHRAPLPAFKEKVPYVIAILDMDEGFRLMVNAQETVAQGIAMDSRVRVGFMTINGVALPVAEELL